MPNDYDRAADQPRIWYSRLLSDIDIFVDMDCVMTLNERKDRIIFNDHYLRWEPDDRPNAPEHLFFSKGTNKIKASARDAFQILNGYVVISPKFRDLLRQFDLGSTRLIEVPIYRSDGKTLADFPPHYVLHVTETKPTLIPEESKNIKRPIPPGASEPLPHARWSAVYSTDELTVKATSADGVDLWADPILRERLFLSDRLKQAIEANEIKSRGFDFVAAKVLR